MRALLLVALLAGCKDPTAPPNPNDNGIDAGTGTPCEQACSVLVQLKCTEPFTAKGTPCAAVCENLESSGIVSWDPKCVASEKRIVTCDDVARFCKPE